MNNLNRGSKKSPTCGVTTFTPGEKTLNIEEPISKKMEFSKEENVIYVDAFTHGFEKKGQDYYRVGGKLPKPIKVPREIISKMLKKQTSKMPKDELAERRKAKQSKTENKPKAVGMDR